VLATLGQVPGRLRSPPYRREWRRPGEAVASLEVTHADNPIPIELHGGLDRDFFGVRRITFDDDPALTARADGTLALAQPLLWVYLAAHASEELHRLQLLRLVELILVARTDLRSAGDWEGVRTLARRLDARRFLYPAAALAARLAPDAIDQDTLDCFADDASPRMRRFIDRLDPAAAHRLDGLSLADRFLWVKGAGETARRAAYLLWPARSGAVGATYADRVWRLLRGRVSLGSER
jgi:hypothetical protein